MAEQMGPRPLPDQARLVEVMMAALARSRVSLEMPSMPLHHLEQQATVMVHALYAQGWVLCRSTWPVPGEEPADYVERMVMRRRNNTCGPE